MAGANNKKMAKQNSKQLIANLSMGQILNQKEEIVTANRRVMRLPRDLLDQKIAFFGGLNFNV